MKRIKYFLLGVLIISLGYGGWYVFTTRQSTVVGAQKTVIHPNDKKIKSLPVIDKLHIPSGFSLSLFAQDVTGARVMVMDPQGRILISQTKQGRISVLEDADNNGKSDSLKMLVQGLKNPHGLALSCKTNTQCVLYVAESTALEQFDYAVDTAVLTNRTKLATLSYTATDENFTRSLFFLPPPQNDTLLISVGSSCDACNETDVQHAKILYFNTKTHTLGEYASGVRNSVFFAHVPQTNQIYATEVGRGGLGDALPPDELNSISGNANYGWPYCYGKNIHDDIVDPTSAHECVLPRTTPSSFDFPAHSVPLGLAFVPSSWPQEYQGGLLVALHGDGSMTPSAGYRIVLLKPDGTGGFDSMEDFISGWLATDGTVLGQPVALMFDAKGNLYISDDSAGNIYKVTPQVQ